MFTIRLLRQERRYSLPLGYCLRFFFHIQYCAQLTGSSFICRQQACEEINKNYDSVIDIFESLGHFLGRLTLYLKPNVSSAMKEVIIKILAHLLWILGMATRLIRENRAGK